MTSTSSAAGGAPATRTIVIAPDSFKGTIAAADAATALAEGWLRAFPHDRVMLAPMADGGEGTLRAFATAVPSSRTRRVVVGGPAGEPVQASWLLLPASKDAPSGTGVVELASTSGIELLAGGPLLPLDAHTRGFGEAIADALDHGVSRLVLAIGSSASTDGGMGALRALGARFLDSEGLAVPDGARGLLRLASADLSALRAIPEAGALVLSDVRSPLTGPLGAARVFGPQKGLREADIEPVDRALGRLAVLIGVDATTPGAGAAGGAGAAMLALGAVLLPGAAAVAELIGLERALAGADLVVTGEGAFDLQTAGGKVPSFVLDLASAAGVPVALVAGRVDADARALSGFAAALSLAELAGSADAALRHPRRWLTQAGARLAATTRQRLAR